MGLHSHTPPFIFSNLFAVEKAKQNMKYLSLSTILIVLAGGLMPAHATRHNGDGSSVTHYGPPKKHPCRSLFQSRTRKHGGRVVKPHPECTI